jgi:glutaredoxin-dependent peroxiredoxin
MKAFQQNLAKLEASDTQVLGVSVDSPFANGAWAKQIGVTFPILSDLGGDTSKDYGVYNPKYKAARRVTYLIDKDGKVVHMNVDKEALDPTNVVAACERRKLKN